MTPTFTFTPTPTNTFGPVLPSTNLSIGGIVTNKGGTPVAGGNYSLQAISQDADPNASPTNINTSSVSRPDTVAPHAISEFIDYHHI